MILEIPKYFKRKDLSISGIYFLIKRRKVVYIGQTSNIAGRLSQGEHLQKDYDKIRIIPCKENKRSYYESRLIKLFRPKYNRMHVIVTHGSNRGFKCHLLN